MGFYTAPPGHRMAYDQDGTIGMFGSTSSMSPLSTAQLEFMNNESTGDISFSSGTWVALIFPQLRDIVGVLYSHGAAGSSVTVQTSPNTTNGVDGTWTTVHTSSSFAAYSTPEQWRNNIFPVTSNGIKGVRCTKSIGGATDFYAFHVYGSITSGQTPDRLRLWHPTLDQEVSGSYFDWEEVSQGSTVTRQFRVKNNSSTLTANTITVSREALTDSGTQTTVAAHQLSDDNITYGNTVSISSLAPGAISGIIYLKYAPTTSALTGLRWLRLNASAATWT